VRVSKLGLFSILLSVSSVAAAVPCVAFAQQAETPPSGAPIAGPNAPGADTVTPPANKPPPKPLIWRGTSATMDTAVTTTTVGVGRSNIGTENDYAGLEWDFTPNIYVLDKPDDKINIDADIGAGVELTNSDTTLTRREPYFKDIQLGGTYTRNIFTSKDKEWSTKAKLRVRGIFPTSKVSIDEGKYFTSQLGASVVQQIKLLGNDADGLNNLTVTLGFGWSHLFSRSFTPTNESLQRIRQNANGQSAETDSLTFNSFDVDRLIPRLQVDLPLYGDLSLSVWGRLIGRFKHKFDNNACVQTPTGCAGQGDPNAEQITYVTNSTFDVSLDQSIYGLVDVSIGYDNETLTLGEDGLTRNPFYSPDAQFYLDITANIDEIYSKGSGRTELETPASRRARLQQQADSGITTGMPSF